MCCALSCKFALCFSVVNCFCSSQREEKHSFQDHYYFRVFLHNNLPLSSALLKKRKDNCVKKEARLLGICAALRFCYLIPLNLEPIMVGPAVLCDGNGCAGEGSILPGLEPGLGVAAGPGWCPWPRCAVALVQPVCPQDPAEFGVWDYGVGSVAPLCWPGWGLRASQVAGPKYGPHFQGNPGKIQCCCWQHQSPHCASAELPEFSGIRCLHTKLSRCGCVGWAETFLCRSNMQLMPMIEDLA